MWLMSAYGYKGNRTADAENHLYEEFSTSELLPADILNQSRFHLFYPVRFNEICIGYIVMDDISFYAKVNFLSTILMVFENAIENARKKDLLQSMNEKLDDLYSRDPLTGLYNRFGMNKYGKQIYDDLIMNAGKAYFSFVDIDNMKYINDNFGHDQGDNAIVSVSETIKKTCSEIEAFAMRYGGDEFIVISGTSIRELIEKNLHEIEVKNGMEYPFTVSVGEYVVDRRDGISIEQGIENADDEMYMIKKTHKMSNGPAGKEVS
jgi:diguanylate cyclase (GGDEF)-like protein